MVWSATQGWAGFAREELSLHPWLNFYVQDGHACGYRCLTAVADVKQSDACAFTEHDKSASNPIIQGDARI